MAVQINRMKRSPGSVRGVSMRYMLAFFPPLAILLCGRPFLAVISIFFCVSLVGYFPAVLCALLIVSSHKADVRSRNQIKSAGWNSKAQIKAIERQTWELGRALREQQEARIILVNVSQTMPARSLLAGRRQLPSPSPGPINQVIGSLFTIANFRAGIGRVKQGAVLAKKATIYGCGRAKQGAVLAKDGAIYGYQNLPEWAQPITWGLAAATPISIVVIILFISHH